MIVYHGSEKKIQKFNIKENEMLNLSKIDDKVFKARRNSNKDVYYIDLQER